MNMRKRFAVALGLVLAAALGSAALSPSGASTYSVAYTFCSQTSCTDGGGPAGPLLKSGNKFYGTTAYGGANDGGAVYRFNPSSSNYAVIYSFCVGGGTCPNNPIGNLVIDTSGNLYGVERFGGTYNRGGVYELVKPVGSGSWTYVDIYDFCPSLPCTDGGSPIDGLTYAGQGSGAAYGGGSALLYGVTTTGGSSDKGVVFALHLGSGGTWSERVLHSFTGSTSDGDTPQTHPYVDASNNLWGATAAGGSYGGSGVAYEMTPVSNPWSGPWTEKIVFNFCWSGISGTDCPLGSSPVGMTMDGNGDLVGVTRYGGAGGTSTSDGGGILFKLTVGSSCTEGGTATFLCMTDLYDFCIAASCADGQYPGVVPTIDSSGNIFGTTGDGGNAYMSTTGGVVYEYNTSESTLYKFCGATNCNDGRYPNASVVLDGSGNLYGTTVWNGSMNGGVIYELTP